MPSSPCAAGQGLGSWFSSAGLRGVIGVMADARDRFKSHQLYAQILDKGRRSLPRRVIFVLRISSHPPYLWQPGSAA
jgi:hypothetical protein